MLTTEPSLQRPVLRGLHEKGRRRLQKADVREVTAGVGGLEAHLWHLRGWSVNSWERSEGKSSQAHRCYIERILGWQDNSAGQDQDPQPEDRSSFLGVHMVEGQR